jgi:hypothetical protein
MLQIDLIPLVLSCCRLDTGWAYSPHGGSTPRTNSRSGNWYGGRSKKLPSLHFQENEDKEKSTVLWMRWTGRQPLWLSLSALQQANNNGRHAPMFLFSLCVSLSTCSNTKIRVQCVVHAKTANKHTNAQHDSSNSGISNVTKAITSGHPLVRSGWASGFIRWACSLLPLWKGILQMVWSYEQKTKTKQKNHNCLFAGLRVYGQKDGLCIIGELPRAQNK